MVNAPGVVEVACEPFVVVREVMNLIGHHAVTHHVGVIDPGAGFLLPGGIVIALESRENVTGHVPHVRDTG